MTKEHQAHRLCRPAKQNKNVINCQKLWKAGAAVLLVCGLPWFGEAKAGGVDICAIVAGKIMPEVPGRVALDARLAAAQQAIRNRVYSKCAELRGKRTAQAPKAAAKAGAFTTFDVPGAVQLNPG